ncbi:hypothetical protein EV182_006122 [Spiromyces aspiralis]|uniref:Uncharacterized protein n=1 Tax=Spiromyces aspiralis TaxID=68401 RepID=A0ACC1HMN6_9FUNG|nr:hypothetical protein EV182_006122 [Spiromyces aspiralis]
MLHTLSSRFLLSVSLALALLSFAAIPTIADTTSGNSESLPSEYSGDNAPKMTDADIVYMVCRVIAQARNGKKILLNNDLSKVAQYMADYNHRINTQTHINPADRGLDDRQKRYGLNDASSRGENATPRENVVTAMDSWMDSPKHLVNMQNPDHTYIGVARSGNYWFQEFFGPLDKSKAPPGIEVNCDGYNQDPTKNKAKTLPNGSQSNSQSKGNADNSQGGNGGDNNGSNSQNGESTEPKSTPPSSAGRSVSIKTVTKTVVEYNTATRQA